MHINDVVNGYSYWKMILSKNLILKINFGSGKPITVINLVKIILKILKKNNFFIIKNNAKNEIKDQYSGYKLAKNKINWKPKTHLKEGILKHMLGIKVKEFKLKLSIIVCVYNEVSTIQQIYDEILSVDLINNIENNHYR